MTDFNVLRRYLIGESMRVSQRDIAMRTGLNHSTISRICSYDLVNPTLQTLIALEADYKKYYHPKKVYISGPITDKDLEKQESNMEAFDEAESKLRDLGYNVVNPCFVPCDEDKWESHMRSDIKELMDCEYIYMLDGWENSRGACIEFGLAMFLKIEHVKNI